MRFLILISCFILSCFLSATPAFAQTPTERNNIASNSGVLSSFISGFDWISGGLIFYTPSLLDQSIKLQDGTELAGMGTFRTIFYDIAIPLFVLISAFVAFSHLTNDNSVQLQQFFKRLLFIIALFLITPAILTYSIQFINLLNAKIIASNSYNLSTFVNGFVSGFTEIPLFRDVLGGVIFVPSWDTVLKLIILIISVGFLLIGFIYIVFQAVIRFISLLVLSVIFPIVLPFALSEKTENIANTYFRTWFTFLIQQPAFVLGFAIVSTILTSISQAHNNSIGTLFVYSGSLLFLGGVNVFIAKIFGDGWSLVTTNTQSMIASRGLQGISRNEKLRRIPSYAGRTLASNSKNFMNKASSFITSKKILSNPQSAYSNVGRYGDSRNIGRSTNKITKEEVMHLMNNNDTKHHVAEHRQSPENGPSKQFINKKQDYVPKTQTKEPHVREITTRREKSIKPVTVKRPSMSDTSHKVPPIKKAPRRKILL